MHASCAAGDRVALTFMAASITLICQVRHSKKACNISHKLPPWMSQHLHRSNALCADGITGMPFTCQISSILCWISALAHTDWNLMNHAACTTARAVMGWGKGSHCILSLKQPGAHGADAERAQCRHAHRVTKADSWGSGQGVGKPTKRSRCCQAQQSLCIQNLRLNVLSVLSR